MYKNANNCDEWFDYHAFHEWINYDISPMYMFKIYFFCYIKLIYLNEYGYQISHTIQFVWSPGFHSLGYESKN